MRIKNTYIPGNGFRKRTCLLGLIYASGEVARVFGTRFIWLCIICKGRDAERCFICVLKGYRVCVCVVVGEPYEVQQGEKTYNCQGNKFLLGLMVEEPILCWVRVGRSGASPLLLSCLNFSGWNCLNFRVHGPLQSHITGHATSSDEFLLDEFLLDRFPVHRRMHLRFFVSPPGLRSCFFSALTVVLLMELTCVLT